MVVAIQGQPPCERMTNDLHWVEAPAAEENDVVATDRVNEIFADARAMQAQALQRLEQGDVRDAAEKAWCATKRATDALVLARTGEEPELSRQTAQELRKLQGEDPAVRQYNLRGRYYTRQGALHGDCFYFGLCDPLDETERLIRETIDYVIAAEALAQ